MSICNWHNISLVPTVIASTVTGQYPYGSAPTPASKLYSYYPPPPTTSLFRHVHYSLSGWLSATREASPSLTCLHYVLSPEVERAFVFTMKDGGENTLWSRRRTLSASVLCSHTNPHERAHTHTYITFRTQGSVPCTSVSQILHVQNHFSNYTSVVDHHVIFVIPPCH